MMVREKLSFSFIICYYYLYLEINIPKELEYNEDDIEKDLEDDSSDGGSEESWSDSGMDQFTQEIR